MDHRLGKRLSKIEKQIDVLKRVERIYLDLDAHKKVLAAQLYLSADGKSVAEKEAVVYSSNAWIDFTKGLSEAESNLNHEKRRYELRLKAFEAEYGTYKVEAQAIAKQGMVR